MESRIPPLWLLNYYREAEMRSADLLQRLLRCVDDPELQVYLTRQLADEARHIQLWTETLKDLGGMSTVSKKGYRHYLQRRTGAPTSVLEMLALICVLEEKVQQRYQTQLLQPGENARVGELLQTLVTDESWHLAGVWGWLAKIEQQEGKTRVGAMVNHYRPLEARAYADFVEATRSEER